LPGHGAPLHAGSTAAMREELARLVDEMKA
jgi:hypothetical protein